MVFKGIAIGIGKVARPYTIYSISPTFSSQKTMLHSWFPRIIGRKSNLN